MKYLAVALHAAIVFCAIDYRFSRPVTVFQEPPKVERYCLGYQPMPSAAFPCSWIPMQQEV